MFFLVLNGIFSVSPLNVITFGVGFGRYIFIRLENSFLVFLLCCFCLNLEYVLDFITCLFFMYWKDTYIYFLFSSYHNGFSNIKHMWQIVCKDGYSHSSHSFCSWPPEKTESPSPWVYSGLVFCLLEYDQRSLEISDLGLQTPLFFAFSLW